jgi:hypothetical protein
LQKEHRTADATRLARDALKTFEQLENWAKADASRAAHMEAVQCAAARMNYVAGELEAARTTAEALVQKDPRNGAYQRLLAQVLTEALPPDAPADTLTAARNAWEAILRDSTLRATQPDAYWEARYQFLAILLREGRTSDVEKAIRQEEAWYPELGGPTWRTKFITLRDRAAAR